jgi:GTP-binding protein
MILFDIVHFMNITKARFIGGVVGPDPLLDRDYPQVAFIGRSNVGKSSVINSLTKSKGLAKTSSFPGRTQEINLFLINEALYLVDLPGYGFAKLSKAGQQKLRDLIFWYLFESGYTKKAVVFIIDAYVGLTESDREMLEALEAGNERVIVVANKTDKIKRSEYKMQMDKIIDSVGEHRVIPFSNKDKRGINDLTQAILE